MKAKNRPKPKMAEPSTLPREHETKKRRRGALNDLRDNWRDERSSKPSLLAHTSPKNPNNLMPRSLADEKRTWVSRHRQGVNLSIRQREAQFDYLQGIELFVDQAALLPGMAAKRRETFALFYYQFLGSPPREKWSKCVSYIAQLLHVAPGSRDTIYRVFEDCEHAEKNENVYSSSANAIKSGRHRKIQNGTPEAKIVYDIIEQGLGSTSPTFVLNAYFTRQGSPDKHVSLHAVKNFIKDNPCVIITRNTGGKSGKDERAHNGLRLVWHSVCNT